MKKLFEKSFHRCRRLCIVLSRINFSGNLGRPDFPKAFLKISRNSVDRVKRRNSRSNRQFPNRSLAANFAILLLFDFLEFEVRFTFRKKLSSHLTRTLGTLKDFWTSAVISLSKVLCCWLDRNRRNQQSYSRPTCV